MIIDFLFAFTISILVGPATAIIDPLADEFDALASAAQNGDSAAALYLGTTLRQCIQYRDRLDAKFVQAQRQFAARHADNFEASQRAESKARSIEILIDRCRGLTPGQLGSFLDWLILAAEAGETAATLSLYDAVRSEYLSEVQRDAYVPKILSIFENQLEAGDPEPFHHLGLAYIHGEIVPRDLVRAAAYYYAWSLSMPHEPGPAMLFDDLVVRYGLSDLEIERARNQGLSLARCCR